MDFQAFLRDLAELDRLNRELDRLKNDQEYIARKTREVFGDTDYTSDVMKAVEQIIMNA